VNNFKGKTALLIISFLVVLTGNLFAQSNDIVDELLMEDEASFGKTAYLVLVATNVVSELATIDDAVSELQTLGWKLDSKGNDEPVKLGELSLMLMKSLDINGGIMYRITKNARYACRELSYLGLIIGNKSPYRTLSGEEALSLISRVIEWKQNHS